MPYTVVLERAADKALQNLPRLPQERLRAHIDALAQEPRPHGCRKLVGFVDRYRIRIGIYRVVYRIEDARLRVIVIDAGHRREVYR